MHASLPHTAQYIQTYVCTYARAYNSAALASLFSGSLLAAIPYFLPATIITRGEMGIACQSGPVLTLTVLCMSQTARASFLSEVL